MKNDLDLKKWSSKLKSTIECLLKNEMSYDEALLKLPEFIDLIPQELKDLPTYGHPISWLLYGHIGVKSFAIGYMTTQSPEDDCTEKHMVPPILSKALLMAGPEYAFSQEAIVITSADANESEIRNTWLNKWLDERSYMHRISLEEGDNMEDLARRLIRIVFFPWQSLRSLRGMESWDEYGLIFESADEEEDEHEFTSV